jgi:hypothetical protein
MRQMRDPLLRALALGDVLDGGDPAAPLERLVDDLDRPAAGRFRQLAGSFAKRHVANDCGAECLDVAVERSGFLAMLDQPLHGAAGFGDIRRQPEHVAILLIADHDARRAVVQHEALRNVADRRVKMAPFGGQRPVEVLMTLQQNTDSKRQDADDGKQNGVKNGPGGQRDTNQHRGCCRTAESDPLQHPQAIGKLRLFGGPISTAVTEPIQACTEPAHASPNSRHACAIQVEVALRL